jgi:hypothetical protein
MKRYVVAREYNKKLSKGMGEEAVKTMSNKYRELEKMCREEQNLEKEDLKTSNVPGPAAE